MTYLAKHARVSEDDETVLGPRQSHVETARVVEEADTLMFVASNARQDDVIFLSSLECVHAGDLDLLVQVFAQRSVELHVIRDVRALPFVRSNDTDLRGDHPRLEEACHNLFDIGGFGPEVKTPIRTC